MADYIKPVVFRLGNQNFGVDINLVQSIEREINIVPVPNSMTYISGIVNLRGEVIPAFSLKKKFRMDDGSLNPSENSIIINIPGVIKLAVEVDDVLEIGDMDEDSIVPMPLIAKTDETAYLDRVANANGNLIILLDAMKLLTETELENVKKFTEEMNADNGGRNE